MYIFIVYKNERTNERTHEETENFDRSQTFTGEKRRVDVVAFFSLQENAKASDGSAHGVARKTRLIRQLVDA